MIAARHTAIRVLQNVCERLNYTSDSAAGHYKRLTADDWALLVDDVERVLLYLRRFEEAVRQE